MIKAGQIYFIANVALGKVSYGRPVLVLRVSAQDATICYFSTKFNLSARSKVEIHLTDPDFIATGLKLSSYIMDQPVPDVPLAYFNTAKLRGVATGDFKKRVEDWYGAVL